MPMPRRQRREILGEQKVNNGQVRAELVREADPDSRPVVHHRAVDTLYALERNRAISGPMREAGDEFRRIFRLAALDRLQALPLIKIAGGAPTPVLTVSQIAARKRAHAALDVLGGMASPAGSAMWHIVGCETSIREWALREGWGGRRLSDRTACGILIGALGALAVHFGFERIEGALPPPSLESPRRRR